MTFNDAEFKACPRCGVEPKVEDVRERSLTKPNVMSVTCPACGMSNSIASVSYTHLKLPTILRV